MELLCVITGAELYAGSAATDAAHQLLGPFRELPVGRDIAERAGRVRRETGVRIPEALIAATALEHGLSLVTRNSKDFEPIRGLRIRSLR